MDSFNATLFKVAKEKSVSVDTIPHNVISVIADFHAFYLAAKKESENVEGMALHNGVIKYSLNNMLRDLYHWERDTLPTKLLISNYLIENDNEPMSKSRIEKVGFTNEYWPFWPAVEYVVKDEGLVAEIGTFTEKKASEEYKYPFIEMVRSASRGTAPKLSFLGEPSIKSLESLCNDFSPERFKGEYDAYLENRIEAYSKLDGTPRKGHGKRIEALMKLKSQI